MLLNKLPALLGYTLTFQLSRVIFAAKSGAIGPWLGLEQLAIELPSTITSYYCFCGQDCMVDTSTIMCHIAVIM